TLMDLPGGKKKYSFPVILGMNPNEPMSTRMPRMKIYNDLVSQLDADGGHYSQALSEVDISDADDVKVLANDPEGEVLVHLGSSDYLERYKIYVGHVREWRQQFTKLESVDLRYDRQIVVNPDMPETRRPPVLSQVRVKAAMAAGVKRASLVTHIPVSAKAPVAAPLNKTAVNAPVLNKPIAGKPAANKVAAKKAAPKKKVVSAAHRKPPARKAHAKALAASVKKPAPPKPSAQKPPAKTSSIAMARPVSNPSKKKPSPAIAKSQENP
ncbi:MAG TPA: hypothetical protein VH079_16275, partial [Terriglobales bacterium]|nr:hypothetical protein [Terriglobales bacterium]